MSSVSSCDFRGCGPTRSGAGGDAEARAQEAGRWARSWIESCRLGADPCGLRKGSGLSHSWYERQQDSIEHARDWQQNPPDDVINVITTSTDANGGCHIQPWEWEFASHSHLPSVVLSLQLAVVLLSWGETCRYNAAGPEQPRSAAGYTPNKGSSPHPDLEKKIHVWTRQRSLARNWSWSGSDTWGRSLLDGERVSAACAQYFLTHSSKGNDLPTLQELRGAERSLHHWEETAEMGFKGWNEP